MSDAPKYKSPDHKKEMTLKQAKWIEDQVSEFKREHPNYSQSTINQKEDSLIRYIEGRNAGLW